MKKIKNNKGIALVSLTIAIIILIVLTSMLIYNAKNGIKMRTLKMMQNDIDLLSDEISSYYAKYGDIPAEIEYLGPINFEKQPNDDEKYYVIDLSAFEDITLNYGLDYNNISSSADTQNYDDVYIINKQSMHVYYARGIEMDGIMYYTNDEDEEVELVERWGWTSAFDSNENYVYGIDSKGDLYKLNETFSGLPIDIEKQKMMNCSAANHTVLIIEGKVYTWGYNEYGQLGNGTTKNSDEPICISEIEGNILKGKKIVEVSTGPTYTIAIDSDGKVYTWGVAVESSTSPICISEIEGNILKDKRIVGVSAVDSHIAVIDDEGKVYTWGSNEFGQLGNGTIEDSKVPICISEIEGNILKGKKIVEVSTGVEYTVAIDNEGKVYTWGALLGNGTEEFSMSPICISEIEENILKGKKIVKVSAGDEHTVAIDDEGKMYTWGYNRYGQLGNGTIEASISPICISEIEGNILKTRKIIGVSAGSHTIAIDDEGKVYTWGRNDTGQLGDGTYFGKGEPICISEIEGNILKGKKIVEVSAGNNHTVAIDNKGNVYTWGNNEDRQLGTSQYITINVPICILEQESRCILKEKKIVKVLVGGYDNTIAIDNEGKVYTWGNNEYGQLGNGTNEDSNEPICISEIEGSILKGKKIVEVLTEYGYIIAIDDEGKVYTWGNNEEGQLGNGTNEDSNVPICISEIDGNILKGNKIVKASAVGQHVIVLDNEGKVYTWGNNYNGQLGNGTNEDSNEPMCISEMEENILKGKNIIDIANASSHTVAIDDEGKVYTWGNNSYGELGNGTDEGSNEPICISEIEGNILKGKKIVEVSVGYDNITAIDDEGKVYTWGHNDKYQLGNGTSKDSNEPICISEIDGNILKDNKIVKVSVGKSCTIALDDEGKVYIWGRNYTEQFGNGAYKDGSMVPICISEMEGNILKGKNIIDIANTSSHTIALDDEGKVYIFGKFHRPE